MKIALPYGRTSERVAVPDGALAGVLERRGGKCGDRRVDGHARVHGDDRRDGRERGQRRSDGDRADRAAVRRALDRPYGYGLEEVARRAGSDGRIAIAVSDMTRPVPTALLLDELLPRLRTVGVAPSRVQVIVGGGQHRPPTEEELRAIAGPAAALGAEVLVHDGEAPDLVHVGVTSRGTPIWINRPFAEATARIVTGMIEPHQLVGVSGGAKAVFIGLGGRETCERNHALLSDPKARPGVVAENPLRQDIEELPQFLPVDFLLNVVLDGEKRVATAVAGEYRAAFAAGCELSLAMAEVGFGEPADVVLVSAGGHPKDIDLYQAQKALSHAQAAVKRGGVIALLAACPAGLGDERFAEEIAAGVEEAPRGAEAGDGRGDRPGARSAAGPEAWIDRFERLPFRLGAHKAFLLSRTLTHADVHLVSEMDDETVRQLHMQPYESAQRALDAALDRAGPGGRVFVIPHGASVVPARSSARGPEGGA